MALKQGHTMFLFLVVFMVSEGHSTLQYGYYSPYPPEGTAQVFYEFSPLPESRAHRTSRDLAWKEFDVFLNGEAEPSCEDLRKMWKMARRMQQESIRTNEIPQQVHPFMSSPSKTSGSLETAVAPADTSDGSQRKTDRRRFSNPTAVTNAIQRKNLEDEVARDLDGNDQEQDVYGVVRTAPPQPSEEQQQDNIVRVRDPAKEIYGLIRDRANAGRHAPSHSYGVVRTHAPAKSEQKNYLDILQQKLFGKNSNDNQEEKEPIYGVVRYQVDNGGQPNSLPQTGSSFDTVRDLLASNSPGENTYSSEGSSFDLIRQRLLNSRSNNGSEQRSLRRKNSSKRRRNVEEFAELERQILNDYIRGSSGTLEKIFRKNRRERKRQRRQKLRLLREKQRRRNLLLKKLGK